MIYAQVPSPNFSDKVIVPRFIVVHYTASSSAESAINWMANPDSKVSAHLVIAKDGEVTQMVPFYKKAWHAGPSSHSGWRHLNSHSIGIELVNKGDQEYPEEQLCALEGVIRQLKEEYPTIFQVVGHSEIDTRGIKMDPGPLFPMERFRMSVDEKTFEVTANKLNVRSLPNGSSSVIGVMRLNETFPLAFNDGDWARIKGGGWVHRNFIRRIA